MGDVVNIPLRSRRVVPVADTPVSDINLDAIGRLGALLVQIAALEPASNLPAGTSIAIVRDGARVMVAGDEAVAVAEELMDAKDWLLATLGPAGRRMLGDCLTTLRDTYDAA